jgi:hypothetical protein
LSDPVTLARSARESLARGLQALQEPGVPAHLIELAAPIAQAMGELHQIERSGGALASAHAPTAMGHVQQALAQLQAQPPTHPAVMASLEAVAGALGSLHQLAQARPREARPAAPEPPRPRAPSARPVPQPAQPAVQLVAQPIAPPVAAPAPATAPQAIPLATAPTVAAVDPPPAAPRHGGTAPIPAARPVEPAAPPRQDARAERVPTIDAPVIAAELGAHSPSNFYKGLSGNDIVDHGGLFVSTYKLPKLGQPVRLRVSLPGGYEFEANAVVRWRREPGEADADAPPGFGAQIVAITAEARQLVYRYARNREPLFHDDL